ncbi:hypothetical protein FXW78_51445 [Rhodococcus opacus]|nr:hypothetical protein [Rhodococcus opacus]
MVGDGRQYSGSTAEASRSSSWRGSGRHESRPWPDRRAGVSVDARLDAHSPLQAPDVLSIVVHMSDQHDYVVVVFGYFLLDGAAAARVQFRIGDRVGEADRFTADDLVR